MSVLKLTPAPSVTEKSRSGAFQNSNEEDKAGEGLISANIKNHPYQLTSINSKKTAAIKTGHHQLVSALHVRSTPPLRPFIQTKLSVNKPGDQYEQEADAVTDKIMRIPYTLSSPVNTGLHVVQRKCAACDEEEEKHVQRKETANLNTGKNDALASYVNSLNSSGHPLSEPARQFFEPRFGYDFSRVRIHSDDDAARSARSVNALAYTTGNHIVFDRGQYSPDSVDGKRLLAHELTHSIQQSAGAATAGTSDTRVMRQPNTSPPPQGGTHPSVMQDIGAKFQQFYAKLSPEARYRLNRNSTIAIGVVTEQSDTQANSPRFVYTTAGNTAPKEIQDVAAQLGLTRWQPSSRAAGRGAVGAPNDAEQLLTEGADANHFRVWAIGASRGVCTDCQVHVHDADIPVRAFPDTAFRQGGSLYGYTPPPAAGKTQGTTGATAGAADDADKGPGTTVKPSTPAGAPGADDVHPTTQGAAKPTAGSVAGHDDADIHAAPAPKTTVTAPQTCGARQVGIDIGIGVAGVLSSMLAGYLKGKVDQKIFQRQVEAYLALAKNRINANPDEALKKMMVNPDATVYAWVSLSSAVIKTLGADTTSLEPAFSDSSPILDLSRIDYATAPVPPEFAYSFPTFLAGGRHVTVVTTIIIDLPLKTPPLADMIDYAKARHLPMDNLLAYVNTRYQTALKSYIGALDARASILQSFQTTSDAYDRINAAFKIAQKNKDVELQKYLAKQLLEVSGLSTSIVAQLPPVVEIIEKSAKDVKYWEHIVALVKAK